MREIKFRGKRVDNGEWVYGNLITTSNGYHFIDTHNELYEDEPYLFRDNTDMIRVAVSKVIPETVGQFTGLKDKNGVEIYEGDICEYGFNAVLCEWFKGGFWLNGSQKGANYNIHLGNNIYVIGNIHDNPELLKTE